MVSLYADMYAVPSPLWHVRIRLGKNNSYAAVAASVAH